MDFRTRIKIKMYELVHAGKPSIDECADVVNKTANYLYRLSSMTEDLPTPIEYIVPLMKLKKNYSLLAMLAQECGFALFKLPAGINKKGSVTDLAAEYQQVTTEAGTAVVKFLNKPSEQGYKRAIEALSKVISESVSIKKVVSKTASGQVEIEFDNIN